MELRDMLPGNRSINDEVGMHRHEFLRCDFSREDPTLEKARPTAGWVIEVRPS
jgi:hypothetical protein